MKIRTLSKWIVVAALFSLNANASSFTTSLVGVGDLASLSVSNAPTSATFNGTPVTNISSSNSSKLGFGGGVLFDSMFSPRVGLEFGGLYITRKIETTTSFTAAGMNLSQASTSTNHYLQIPVLMKLRLNRILSIGAGGYYAQGVGTFSTDLKKSDYGFLANVGLQFPVGHSTAFRLDGRYNLGLKNVDNSGFDMTQKYRDVQILAGLTFGLGGGRH